MSDSGFQSLKPSSLPSEIPVTVIVNFKATEKPARVSLDPFGWVLLRLPAGGFTAIICCPNGHEISIEDHKINRNSGDVEPAVVCPGDGCNFHDFIRLNHFASRVNRQNARDQRKAKERNSERLP